MANLLDNAVRHAPDGGLVTWDVGWRDGCTTITVTDDGPGVPSGARARMTQRFTQLDRTETPTGGAGLGLAIVTSVAAAHGGRVEFADATAEGGLSATILLPAASATEPTGGPDPSGGSRDVFRPEPHPTQRPVAGGRPGSRNGGG